MKYHRSIPFFSVLLKAAANKRMSILNSFPSHVVEDLIEVLYNIVHGNVNIGSKSKKLKKHRKALLELVNSKNKKARKHVLFKQKGGFLGALIPIILSTLGGIIGNNI